MNKRQFFIGILLASFLGALVALGGFSLFMKQQSPGQPYAQTTNFRFSKYLEDSAVVVPEGLNFVYAAEKVRPAVVHIKTEYGESSALRKNDNQQPLDDLFKDFFGDESPRRMNPGPSRASGSGVILSQDGYIVTNNHVIDNADKIEVVLDDKRRYYGKVVGVDPTTDLALIKIEEKGLPFVQFGNSEKLKVGEWVLAIGNPYNLTSTVTAGIVSALSRNINILRTEEGTAGIEAFIQTDAAVNPGNSGGALVDLKGNLVGINTAILGGYTGSYTGYSFAVPSSLAKKVMDDLLKYGEVQRGLLGVHIDDIDPDFAEKNNLGRNDGVYVKNVTAQSGAQDAGLKEGDIIIKVDDKNIHTVSELQQTVAIHKPGDKLKVVFVRGGKEKEAVVTLKNTKNNTQLVKKSLPAESKLGAELSEITDKEKAKLNLSYGIKVNKVKGGVFEESGVKPGFIITKINHRSVKSTKEVEALINSSDGRVFVEGVYPDGDERWYVFEIK